MNDLSRAIEAYSSNGKTIDIDHGRDANLTAFGKTTLSDRYLVPGESFQHMFGRVSCAYADDSAHAQRVYDAMSRLWFMPATPVLSNGGTSRGLPISCFLNAVGDSLDGIVSTWIENVWLASGGGGIGTYWGNVRSIGEAVKQCGFTSGIIPFIGVMDRLTLAISQGSLRRGSAAVYLQIDHPEIEEFLEIRKPSGDFNRKALNLHHGVLITDSFMQAVERGEDIELRSPKTGEVRKTADARKIWQKLLELRIQTGEPYLVFIDTVNAQMAAHQRKLGLKITTSNLCSEIMLPTGRDHLGRDRTAVCCLSSLNFETYDEWKDEPRFIEDVLRFLDNVLTDFIASAPDIVADIKHQLVTEIRATLSVELEARLGAQQAAAAVDVCANTLAGLLNKHLDGLSSKLSNARYSAFRERSVGLGVMGYHSFLQARRIPLESAIAKSWNFKLFRHVRTKADAASRTLAFERSPCPDADEAGVMERFSHKIAIAPTASISIICGGASPAIEPWTANIFTHKTLSGSTSVRNKHLEEVLNGRGANDQDTWQSILANEGSVQHLDFLTENEKMVFKTAFELDQRWLIEFAADRTPFICQGQSLNLFLPADIEKWDLHMLHFTAWRKGLKSLYYCRSKSMQRASFAGGVEADNTRELRRVEAKTDYEECLSCQ